jgi:hypothetical protein
MLRLTDQSTNFRRINPTSWTNLFQLVFLNFQDVREVIFNFSTICSGSESRVIQLAAWTNAVWRLAFIRVETVPWPLVLWLVWHRWLKFWKSILSLFWVFLSNVTVVLTMVPGNLPAVQARTGKTVRFGSRTFQKPGPLPVNPLVLPGLAIPVSSNLRFCVLGFSIYGRI